MRRGLPVLGNELNNLQSGKDRRSLIDRSIFLNYNMTSVTRHCSIVVLALLMAICYKSTMASFWLDELYRNEMSKIPVPLKDTGHITSCGPPGASITGTWTPKDIDPQGTLKLTFSMNATVDFNSGSYNVSLYYSDMKEPVISDVGPATCGEINKYITKACPVKKDQKVHMDYTIQNLLNLKDFSGSYRAHLELKNEKKELFLCIEVTATIKN